MPTEIAQVVMDASTVTTISNNINSLYSNAISQLTSYTLGVVGLVGVLIPALVTYIQWKSLKTEKENLEHHITEEITKAKFAIRNELMAELKQLVETEENSLFSRVDEKFRDLEKKLECAEASTFHIQGNSQLNKKLYVLAAQDFCFATARYMRGEDELNGQRTLNSLIQSCLPNLDKTEFEKEDLDAILDQLISLLESINHHNRYSDRIADLNRERKAAKNREPKLLL
jgi:hypothetical protein